GRPACARATTGAMPPVTVTSSFSTTSRSPYLSVRSLMLSGLRTAAVNTSPAARMDEAMIRAVVSRFYALARVDDIIGPVFRNAVADEQWQAHLDTITDFWSSMLLGSGRYHGRPMPKHLALTEL